MSESARKHVPTPPASPSREATREELDAARELLATMLEHNPEPTSARLAEIDHEWDQG